MDDIYFGAIIVFVLCIFLNYTLDAIRGVEPRHGANIFGAIVGVIVFLLIQKL